MLWMMMFLVFVAGCVGGVISLFITGQKFTKETRWWWLCYKEDVCDTYFPGPLGYVITGGVAAVVFWGLYGPFADWPLLGEGGGSPPKFTLSQLVAPILMGIGGPDWLVAQAQKWCNKRRPRLARTEQK